MTQFIQLHLLTAYPPANLNRDDTGRPKTAIMGGAERLRISSQALKRAWRDSELFESYLEDRLGVRTLSYGQKIHDELIDRGVDPDKALEIGKRVGDIFGKLKSGKDDNPTHAQQLAFIDPAESNAIAELVDGAMQDEDVEFLATKII